MARPPPFAPDILLPLKDMRVEAALQLLNFPFSVNEHFRPKNDPETKQLVVVGQEQVVHIVATGPKWYDLGAKVGGYGAIDLGVHLTKKRFLAVVRALLRGQQQAAQGVGRRPRPKRPPRQTASIGREDQLPLQA